MPATQHGVTLGTIVAADYRAAGVLDRFGLDFCCGGKQTLEEACARQAIDAGAVVAQLEALGEPRPGESTEPQNTWRAAELVRFIVERHHAYVRTQLPVIADRLEKLVCV